MTQIEVALIGDCEAAALVGRDDSIDWLYSPRFDSDACFAFSARIKKPSVNLPRVPGEAVSFSLTYVPSHLLVPAAENPLDQLRITQQFWLDCEC